MDNVSLNTDNDALKDKIRSYSTLNSMYHETRQEIDLLNKQIYVKDNIIADLKARLGRYERIYMTVGDNESVVIGPSKSLLESLCKEICKLKQKRNDMEFNASRQTEEIQRLNVQLREKELELENVRCQPDHEKDQEIQRLRSALEERERSEATRAVLCTSLAEEADQLRSQLGATVKVCQELLARMEKEKKGGEEVEVAAQLQNSKEISESSDMNTQIRQLQEENQQLKQRVDICTREVDKVRRRDQERIQTLEQQVLIYTEDFKSERADRERAQGQIEDLKEQVYQLKRQLHKQGASRESREVVPMCRVHIGHRISSRRHKDSSEPLLRNNAEMQQQPAAAAATTSAPAWNDRPGMSELQCPRCLATFNDVDIAEYLNHCEECAKL
ncbi:hypothetical protein D5F01_LYC00513 [Larimichthys crocea]|uniref:CCHC NOA-type domain-containing protein n=1 Tax=Larimichthys crocea TaxID=215358 RepID=A0A6G0J9C4_LARCR|nr:hypothetical protein D5F01_LYC00513 [Larimichthys crocea]